MRRILAPSLGSLALLFSGWALGQPLTESADPGEPSSAAEASQPAELAPAGPESDGAGVALDPPPQSTAVAGAPEVAPTSEAPLSPRVTLGSASVVPNVHPNITDRAYRDLRLSAYALPARTFAFETRLLGVSTEEMIASLGLDYGLGKGVQVGVNVAHIGVGLINLSAKWTFLEKGPVAVSVGFDPMYVHGDWLWIVRMKDFFAGIDSALFPAQLSGSFLATPWLQFDLSARYTTGFVLGSVTTTNVDLQADITIREFAVFPGVRVHLLGRSTLSIAAALPLYRAIPATADVEVELGPGIVAGGSLDGTRTKSLADTYRIEVGVRSMVTRQVFLEFGLNFGAQIEFLYGSPVYPRFGVEVRF